MNPSQPESCPAPCLPKPSLEERPLLSPEQALELVTLFKVLANDTRLRLLHAIVRQGEMGVMELAGALAMKPQAVSNQLQRLLDRGILGSRRAGINIYYRISDPCVISLLDHGLCLSEDAKARMK
jgi:DNA-binding transcriptional ArsR family regulator